MSLWLFFKFDIVRTQNNKNQHKKGLFTWFSSCPNIHTLKLTKSVTGRTTATDLSDGCFLIDKACMSQAVSRTCIGDLSSTCACDFQNISRQFKHLNRTKLKKQLIRHRRSRSLDGSSPAFGLLFATIFSPIFVSPSCENRLS